MNTHLISEVLQMVSVLAAGERCLIILFFFYLANSSRENPGAQVAIIFPETEKMADSTVSMSLLRNYAQLLFQSLYIYVAIFTSLFLIA